MRDELKHALRACLSSIRGLRPLIIPQVGLRPTIKSQLITIKGKSRLCGRGGLWGRSRLQGGGGLQGGADSGGEGGLWGGGGIRAGGGHRVGGKYGFLKAYRPKLPNFSPLQLPHGLDEEPVVLQPDPDHLGEGGQPHDGVPHRQYAPSTKFQDSMAFPWPKRGICCPPPWP